MLNGILDLKAQISTEEQIVASSNKQVIRTEVRGVLGLTDITQQIYLTDINRIFHTNPKELKIYLAAYGRLSKNAPHLGKTSLINSKELINSMYYI